MGQYNYNNKEKASHDCNIKQVFITNKIGRTILGLHAYVMFPFLVFFFGRVVPSSVISV